MPEAMTRQSSADAAQTRRPQRCRAAPGPAKAPAQPDHPAQPEHPATPSPSPPGQQKPDPQPPANAARDLPDGSPAFAGSTSYLLDETDQVNIEVVVSGAPGATAQLRDPRRGARDRRDRRRRHRDAPSAADRAGGPHRCAGRAAVRERPARRPSGRAPSSRTCSDARPRATRGGFGRAVDWKPCPTPPAPRRPPHPPRAPGLRSRLSTSSPSCASSSPSPPSRSGVSRPGRSPGTSSPASAHRSSRSWSGRCSSHPAPSSRCTRSCAAIVELLVYLVGDDRVVEHGTRVGRPRVRSRRSDRRRHRRPTPVRVNTEAASSRCSAPRSAIASTRPRSRSSRHVPTSRGTRHPEPRSPWSTRRPSRTCRRRCASRPRRAPRS